MRIIKTKISLEPYISKQCGIIPSYKSGYDEIINYDPIKDNFSNYGTFPLNVIYNGECLSYSDLIERYNFCKKYVDLLNVNHECRIAEYENALEYYIYEVKHKSNELEQEYLEMDELFLQYGGNDFIKHCEKYFFPIFSFKEQFKNRHDIQNAWTVNRMSFLDVKRWIKKLEKLSKSEVECDKCKYEELFGDDVLQIFKEWLKTLEGITVDVCETYFTLPILLTNSIDNIGEFTIGSRYWEEGKDYSSNDESIIYGGSVIYNEDIYELTSGTGSSYDEIYKENNFDTDAWKPKVIEEVMNIYSAHTKHNNYALKNGVKYALKNGVKVDLGYNPSDNKEKMCDRYDIDYNNDLGYFYISNFVYKVIESDYIFNNGNYYLVNAYEESNINIKRCVINGIPYYSYFEEGKEMFKFTDNDEQEVIVEFNGDNKGQFIIIDNIPLPLENNNTTITLFDGMNNCSVVYHKFEGYANVNGVDIFINNGKSISFLQKQSENEDDYEYINYEDSLTYVGKYYSEDEYNKELLYEVEDNILKVHKPYVVYEYNKLTGYTESKLSLLVDYNICYDDMGNKLPCSMNRNENGAYIQPTVKENNMDIVYHIGNTSQVSKITFTNDEGEEETKYWGNIITNIMYYYKDAYGNKVCQTNNIEETNIAYEDFRPDANLNYYVTNDLMCDVEYYIGAFLTKNDDDTYSYDSDGVKYLDSFKLILSSCDYHISDIDKFMLSYYDYEYNLKYTFSNDYNDVVSEINMAYFEVQKGKSKVAEIDESDENGDIPNDLICDHVFREEYKLGISSREKVDANIHIDRGIASSFEKHLKILDCSSFESLEQFGNGYFNIIKS